MTSAAATSTSPFDAIEAEFVGAIGVGSDPTSLPLASVEVAFAGRSNVGKSSLINALVQRRGLVRTSNTPGCTRQINFFSVRSRDDTRFVFVDLPGYGFAKRSKAEREQWAQLIEGYLARRPTLAALAILVDARRGLEEEELELVRFVTEGRKAPLAPVAIVFVATKADKIPKSKSASLLAAIRKQSHLPVIPFSTEQKVASPRGGSSEPMGYRELWQAIRHAVGIAAPARRV
jgi:GTP-binding protein